MSMYQMVFADGEKGLPLLGALGFKSIGDVGRYRSSWIELNESGDPRIAVYTRNGGGNRECWNNTDGACDCTGCTITNIIPKHPNYLFDKDDDFDCTYCTIYFSIPDSFKNVLNSIDKDWVSKLSGPIDMSAEWIKRIDALKA